MIARNCKLRGLAVTSTTWSEVLPDLSTVVYSCPANGANAWYGLVAAKNTPADVIERLNKETNAVLADLAAKKAVRRTRRDPAAGVGGRLRQAAGG